MNVIKNNETIFSTTEIMPNACVICILICNKLSFCDRVQTVVSVFIHDSAILFVCGV